MDDWSYPEDWEFISEYPHPMRSAFKMALWYIPAPAVRMDSNNADSELGEEPL